MSDHENAEIVKKEGNSPAASDPSSALPPELEKLPPEMKAVVSVMMGGFFRSTSGPDPETAKIMAQTEMHEETCRLEGYKENLKNRDKQNDRDHEFRKKQLNHNTAKQFIIIAVCIVGILAGLYLLIGRGQETLGTGLLVGAFVTLLNGRMPLKGDD